VGGDDEEGSSAFQGYLRETPPFDYSSPKKEGEKNDRHPNRKRKKNSVLVG